MIPALYLPSRFERILARQEEQQRPEHYIVERDDAPTIIIANGSDLNWRAPIDELKAIAAEQLAGYARTERAQSWGDRYHDLQEAWYRQMEKRKLAAQKKIISAAKLARA